MNVNKDLFCQTRETVLISVFVLRRMTSSYVNYTPHTVNAKPALSRCDSLIVSFPSLGVARVTESQEERGTHNGFALRHTTYNTIVGLPEPREGQLCIVSLVVLQANAQLQEPRDDLVAPDTGASCVRFTEGPQKGQINYVTGFCV